MSEQGSNRREFSRVTPRVSAMIVCGQTPVQGPVRDISLNGLFLSRASSFAPGSLCQVMVQVGEGEMALRINASGRVVRADSTGLAVTFDELSRPDFLNLQKLVLFNSRSPDVVQREFDSHLGLRRRDEK